MTGFPRPTGDEPLMLTPATYNQIISRIEGSSRGVLPGDDLNNVPPGCIPVVWNGDDPIGLGQPIGFAENVSIVNDSDESEFLVSNVIRGEVAARSHNMGNWGVAMAPGIKDDIIPVRVWGTVMTKIFVPTGRSTAKYADMADSGGKIQADIGGWARILWKESGDNQDRLAILMMGACAKTWIGTSTGTVAAGATANYTTKRTFTRSAKHDIFSGSIASGRVVAVQWEEFDREWHIVGVDCP